MKILLLGEKSTLLENSLKIRMHNTEIYNDKINIEFVKNYDFIISFGYRHIIKNDVIKEKQGRIINMHISLLPYNRGADPNLWSYLENTPKGVTIHLMDEGLDTGDIIVQKKVIDDEENDTLKTSYDRLISEITDLFVNKMDDILYNSEKMAYSQKQLENGFYTFHYLKDKEPYMHLLKDGYDTKVKLLKNKAVKNYNDIFN